MSFTSDLMALTLQNLDDNPDTWGDVLNTSGIQLLEDGFNLTTIDVTASDATLDNTVGGDVAGHYRYAVINITGTSLAVPRNVNVPLMTGPATFPTKVWLVINSTTGGQVITFKTASGAGVAIPAGEGQWVFCDATDVLAASAATATVAATATLADDSLLLGGDANALFAQKAVANTWTQGQVTERILAADGGANLTVDLSLSNAFFHEMIAGINLSAPTNATDGAIFSLILEQGASPPHTLTFQATTFLWEGGAAPTLSTGLGDIDYLSFEYVTGVATTAKWIGTIIKGIS